MYYYYCHLFSSHILFITKSIHLSFCSRNSLNRMKPHTKTNCLNLTHLHGPQRNLWQNRKHLPRNSILRYAFGGGKQYVIGMHRSIALTHVRVYSNQNLWNQLFSSKWKRLSCRDTTEKKPNIFLRFSPSQFPFIHFYYFDSRLRPRAQHVTNFDRIHIIRL